MRTKKNKKTQSDAAVEEIVDGLPIYTVNRHIEELKVRFEDGSHIVYVNGSYKGNDPIGKLMHDFNCKKSKDMYHKELADGVRHYKEEGGRKLMCEAVEKYAEKKAKKAAVKTTIEDAVSYGMNKEQILQRVTEKYGIDVKEAETLYNTYVKSIA